MSDLGNQSENSAGQGQILSILQVNSRSIDQESGEIWTVQTNLQQIYSKSDSLPEVCQIFLHLPPAYPLPTDKRVLGGFQPVSSAK
jgi:hypothetical protein